MNIIIFLLGVILGLINAPKLTGAISFIIKAQMKIYARQCRIFTILRKRYRDKDAILLFSKENR